MLLLILTKILTIISNANPSNDVMEPDEQRQGASEGHCKRSLGRGQGVQHGAAIEGHEHDFKGCSGVRSDDDAAMKAKEPRRTDSRRCTTFM